MFLLVCITFQVEKSIQLCLLYFKQLQIDSKYLDVFIPEPRLGLVFGSCVSLPVIPVIDRV